MLSIDNNILTTAYTGVVEVPDLGQLRSSEPHVGDVVQLGSRQCLVDDALGNPSLKLEIGEGCGNNFQTICHLQICIKKPLK